MQGPDIHMEENIMFKCHFTKASTGNTDSPCFSRLSSEMDILKDLPGTSEMVILNEH